MPRQPAVGSLPRRILFWTHLIAGVTAGIIILIMSVSGVLLTYERQMIANADLRAVGAAVAGAGSRRSIAELIDAAKGALPEATPTSVRFSRDPALPVQVTFGRDGTVFVNPSNAAVLGRGDGATRDVFSSITAWHRWLGASGEGRDTARAITGAANLAFLVLVLTGVVLWFPRRWTRVQFRAIGWFRGELRGKARDFNWHTVLGIWSFVPLVVIVASGVVISYRWAGDLVYRAAGDVPPAATPRPPAPARASADAGGEGRRAQAASSAFQHLDRLYVQAATRVADWRTLAVALPASADAPVSFTIDRGTGGQPQHRATLTLDPATGAQVAWAPFDSLSPGRRARSFMRFAHTGEYYGLFGQTLAGLVTLATTVLVWTGIALAWRRLLRPDRTESAREALERAA
jgi:uncharacterized iron-regulated membrane protein